jgi:hypothetical protein
LSSEGPLFDSERGDFLFAHIFAPYHIASTLVDLQCCFFFLDILILSQGDSRDVGSSFFGQ